jgi:hypothetical protein
MSNIKKLMVSAAGGDPLDIDDVFSTYLYSANNAGLTITNGIDLAGEGGLVWGKSRSATQNHRLYDTEGNGLYSNYPYGSFGTSGRFTANSDGFDLTASSGIVGGSGYGGPDYVSWTFRKAPKFFDVVTYTGNGTAGRTVSHNLGSVPGMILVKATDSGQPWAVYHRGVASDPETDYLILNDTSAARDNALFWNDTAPTASNFTVGTRNNVNGNGINYVAYLFAHNDGDGEFGPDGDADIIKCGSFTSDSSGNTGDIDIGFEPQFLIAKVSSGTTNDWAMLDNMRGLISSGGTNDKDSYLFANRTYGESTGYGDSYNPQPRGFSGHGLATNCTFVYMAIRRGPLAVPDDATKVFTPALGVNGVNQPAWNSGFPVDMAIDSNIGGGSTDDRTIGSRLTQGRYLDLNSTHQEYAWSDMSFDYMDGYREGNNGSSDMAWMWRRAPGYFDVVAYSGTGTTNQTLNHNLGVAPEMMWVKRRNGGSSWLVYHKGLDVNGDGAPETDVLDLTAADAAFDYKNGWWDTAPTDTQFTVGAYNNVTNNGNTYIAYLFASAPGVSKVGSYTGNGSSQTINCGFTSGARFVLIKRTDSTGSWYVWDTVRGINAGNETGLKWNDTDAEFGDFIDPANSGFTIVQDAAINNNVSGSTYIFYAIA